MKSYKSRHQNVESHQSLRHCYVLTMIAIVTLVAALVTYSSACTLPAIPVNGYAVLPDGTRATLSSKVKANDIVQFECNAEWELHPKVDRRMTCLKTGIWSGSVPECRKLITILWSFSCVNIAILVQKKRWKSTNPTGRRNLL